MTTIRPSHLCLLGSMLGALAGCASTANQLPKTPGPMSEEPTSLEESAIEQHEVCVGSAVKSAGLLADTLYYRATRLESGKLVVGYYAFFSEERPWGNNWMTWTLLPALAIDMVYSHTLLVGPGYQRAASGKADVEGFRVFYNVADDGSLQLERAVADDVGHKPVYLGAGDIMKLDSERPTFYSTWWSHQLGGKGVKKTSDLAYLKCFGPGKLRPLPDQVAVEYGLDHRARPAHLEALGGQRIGASVALTSKSPKL